jgi:hypothetical protein
MLALGNNELKQANGLTNFMKLMTHDMACIKVPSVTCLGREK